jgi:hypothetical protein
MEAIIPTALPKRSVLPEGRKEERKMKEGREEGRKEGTKEGRKGKEGLKVKKGK